VVDVSLLGSGLWAMGMGIDSSLLSQKPWTAPPTGALGSDNPLSGLYRTADDRYLSFVMLQAARYWGEVCHHLGRPDLAEDPRFATAEAISEHAEEACALLREVIAAEPLAHWSERLAGLSGPWAPVQDTLQATGDAQVRSNEYILPVDAEDGSTYELVASPVQFDEVAPELHRAPGFAEHTDEVLLELGYDWDRIIGLKTDGAVT
jgi:crotonobetainyl-CoA:carnitine CoA-transferase CaiB-like acyl-CoA transferase